MRLKGILILVSLINASVAVSAFGEVPVLARGEDLSCFRGGLATGKIPEGPCEAKAIAKWGSGEITYKFSSVGIRDREYSVRPAAEKLRVLILGPGLDGFGLSEEQMVTRLVEEELVRLGRADVEVVNGSIPGFFAPRYASAVTATHLRAKLNPDLVIYYQSGQFFQHDYLEESLIERLDGDRYFKRSAVAAMDWPKSLKERAKPGTFLYDIAVAWQSIRTFWRLYRSAQNEAEEQKLFVQPTFSSFDEIAGRFGPGARLAIVWAPNRAESSGAYRGRSRFLEFIVKLVTPEVSIPGVRLTRALRATDRSFFLLPKDFSKAMENNLVPKMNQFALTVNGAQLWASSVAPFIFDHVNSLGNGYEASQHLMEYHAHRRKQKSAK